MEFEAQYQKFIFEQTKGMGTSELADFHKRHDASGRLFLEFVWWPVMGHFEHLYAEYAVEDFKDGTRYLDFAYLRGPFRINIELDGFNGHQREVSRWQFSDNTRRQNHIMLDGWKIYRFTYDDLKERPRGCQQFIQQVIGKYFGDGPFPELSMRERELVRLALLHGDVIKPIEVREAVDAGKDQLRLLLRGLVEKGVFLPLSEGRRVARYQLSPKWKENFVNLY